MLRKMLLATTLASFALTLPAFGDTLTGTFSFSGTDTGSVNFSALTPPLGSPPNSYIVTSVSGTTNGVAIGGILPADFYPADALDFNDNFVFNPAVGGGNLDFYGLSYYLANGTVPTTGTQCGQAGIATCVNLFYVAPPNFDPGYFTDINNNPSFTALTFSTFFGAGGTVGTVTPEPESLALVGTGILALAGIVRRRCTRA